MALGGHRSAMPSSSRTAPGSNKYTRAIAGGSRDQDLLQRLDLRKEGASPSAHARVIFGHHRYNLDYMKSRLPILRTNLIKVW